MATFVINHWIRGNINVFDIKLTNSFIHLANALLLNSLLIFLLKECHIRSQRHLLALIVTLCWVLASLSKGNGILFSAFIICIELCFFNGLRLWIKNVTKNMVIVYVCGLFVFFSLMIGLVNHRVIWIIAILILN